LIKPEAADQFPQARLWQVTATMACQLLGICIVAGFGAAGHGLATDRQQVAG